MASAPPSIPSNTIPKSEALSEMTDKALPFPSVSVLGVRFDSLTMAQALMALDRFIRERTPRQVCLANAYTLAVARKDSLLLELLKKSDLVLADGMSIVWGARWVGLKLPERVAGPDLTTLLCERASFKGYGIYLMGSSPENLTLLKNVLQTRWPALRIVGTHSPSMCDQFDDKENEQILDAIHAAKPDVLFVGMSAPKQEKWIAQNLHRLNVPVNIGVGAAFDFISGRIPRAPLYLQRVGLEWLYRLSREPRRLWKRYILGNAVFLSLVIREMLRKRFRNDPSARSLE